MFPRSARLAKEDQTSRLSRAGLYHLTGRRCQGATRSSLLPDVRPPGGKLRSRGRSSEATSEDTFITSEGAPIPHAAIHRDPIRHGPIRRGPSQHDPSHHRNLDNVDDSTVQHRPVRPAPHKLVAAAHRLVQLVRRRPVRPVRRRPVRLVRLVRQRQHHSAHSRSHLHPNRRRQPEPPLPWLLRGLRPKSSCSFALLI